MFRPLDPAQLVQLLEGHEDVLTPAIAAEQAFITRTRCPDCQGDKLQKEINSDRPFSAGELLPNFTLRCPECGSRFSAGTFLRLP